MTDADQVFVKIVEQQDLRLGRQVVHDPRSRGFARRITVNRSTWRDKSIRIYDPTPNPNQCHGECTWCAKAMQFNAVGNRVPGRVLRMDTVHKGYSLATSLDPWEGSWEPDDTGSSGLASAKSAQRMGLGGDYHWFFGGADEVTQAVNDNEVVSVGTRWDYDMFEQDKDGRIHLGGGEAGGHQYVFRGYWKSRDWLKGRCWWGDFRDFWIARTDLDTLLHDNGDAHVQKVLLPVTASR